MRQLTEVGVSLTSELRRKVNRVRDTLIDVRQHNLVRSVGNLARSVQRDTAESRRSTSRVEEGTHVGNATSVRVGHTQDATELVSLTDATDARSHVAKREVTRNKQSQRRVEVVRHQTSNARSAVVQRIRQRPVRRSLRDVLNTGECALNVGNLLRRHTLRD